MKNGKQSRMDQVPTVTEKSSGLNYVTTRLNPSQSEAEMRKESTPNDKGGKGK